ncbi:hypothetical protein HPB47_007530 [Ixodes persulcatus]|uniref:Uncharacterized protein n=1 Tax=Ixodes persulcatus TaxID=34615 RepID=A0AC60P773_IXOPE|nr:hypothetical protein HPB47_007530 [Ixodes persulcatus]
MITPAVAAGEAEPECPHYNMSKERQVKCTWPLNTVSVRKGMRHRAPENLRHHALRRYVDVCLHCAAVGTLNITDQTPTEKAVLGLLDGSLDNGSPEKPWKPLYQCGAETGSFAEVVPSCNRDSSKTDATKRENREPAGPGRSAPLRVSGGFRGGHVLSARRSVLPTREPAGGPLEAAFPTEHEVRTLQAAIVRPQTAIVSRNETRSEGKRRLRRYAENPVAEGDDAKCRTSLAAFAGNLVPG